MRRGALPATPVLAVLLMALVEFGQVWFYPGAEGGEGGEGMTRAFGGAFRMTLWLAAVAVILLHLARRGALPMVRALAPFAVFAAWGALVALGFSVDRVTSLRTLVFWSLAAGVAVAAGDAVPAARLARAVALLLGAVVAGSLLLALLLPDAAHTLYGAELMVRGLFPHKNQFGWYAALGLLWTWTLRADIPPGLVRLLLPVFGAGLFVAGSTTAVVVAASAAGYLLGLRLFQALFPDAARAVLALATATLAAALLATVVAPVLLDALGRDPTLTGRTDVWRHYRATIAERTLTGYGPGLFSTRSALNLEVGGTVPGYEREALHSPHSVYLGLVGEVGWPGLAAFVVALLHVAFVAPFRAVSPWLRLSGGLACAILVAGIAEMRDGYAPGVATVALLAARAAALRQENGAARATRRSVTPSRA